MSLIHDIFDKGISTPSPQLIFANPIIRDAYFARKKTQDTEAGVLAGTHTYTFKGNNSTESDSQKTKIANIILDRVNQEQEANKKYTKLEDVKNSLPKKSYSKGEAVTFNLYEIKQRVDFERIDSATIGSSIYLVVETENLQCKNVKIDIKQGDCGTLSTKDQSIPITVEDSEKSQIEIAVSNFAEKSDYVNSEEYLDFGIKEIKLRPKSDEDFKKWEEKITESETKYSEHYIIIDAHSSNTNIAKKLFAYLGDVLDGTNGDENAWMGPEGTWLKLNTNGCIKLGEKDKLIQEINIRLCGFGGNVPTLDFTEKTLKMVKQFQRDYMKKKPTGHIDGETLKAIDKFGKEFKVNFEQIKCKCGQCGGFGKGQDSAEKQKSTIKEKHRKYEYPGIHRSLVWALRAVMFYMGDKEKSLGYSLNKIESGYRCQIHNSLKKRTSTNHMGKALDLHFNKNGTRTQHIADIEEIRSKIFNKYLGAKWDWKAGQTNIFNLESTKKGATTWIHYDVREFDLKYLKDEFFVKTLADVDEKNIVELTKESEFEPVCNSICSCPVSKADENVADKEESRVDPKTLKASDKCIEFIKGWEDFVSKPYDDDKGYCTIGYGHLIKKKKCAEITLSEEFKKGINKARGIELLKMRLKDYEKAVQEDITVNLYQYEYDALVSLLFNTGANFLNVGGAGGGETKIKKNINEKKYAEGADEFADVTNGGSSGLVKRRKAEINMFKNNVYDSSH